MTVKTKNPSKEYPYLAVFRGSIDKKMTSKELDNLDKELIVIISLAKANGNAKFTQAPYVQRLLGGYEGFYTTHEEEYEPLPKGYTIKITQ